MTEILIYGVDGLNPDMIQELGEEEMPNFHKLQNQEDTVYGELTSYVCEGYATPHTGPMWTSIYTGLKPEDHGLLSGGWNDGDSKFHVMNTVWDKISEETSKEMILYGMPMTYKAKQIQGEMVSGFISPSLKSMWSNCVYPETLEERLPDDFIENTASYVAKVKTEGAKPGTETQPFYDAMSKAEENRVETFKELYDEDSADIVAYGTTFADKMGHIAGIKDNEWTRKTYRQVDEILGELLELLQPEHVVVVSDHGFSGFSHSLAGYYLDTTGRGMEEVFDFTPHLLQFFGLEFDENDYGPTNQNQDLTGEEVEDIKDQLDALGYF